MAQIKKISTELQPLDKLLDSSGDAGTSGQILSSTGSGTNWISASSGTITGSGTTGYIPKWTGSSALGDSILEVNSALPDDVIMPQYLRHRGDTNSYFGFYSNDTFIVATSNNEAIRVNASGALLVNRTSPDTSSSRVSVYGMSEFQTTVTNNDDWQNSPITILERDNIGSGQTADKYAPNLNFHWAGITSKSLWMGADGHLSFGEYQSNGNPTAGGTFVTGSIGVGVDNTTPEAKLTVKGDPGNTNQPTRITNNSTDTHTGLFLNGIGNAVDEKYGLQFGGYNEYSIGGIFGIMDSTSASTSGDITIDFGNGTSAGALIEKVRFTHEGNVGIGTASPATLLEVSSASSPNLRLRNTSGNHANSGTVEFREQDLNYGAFIKYNGDANIFQIGTRSSGTDYARMTIVRDSGYIGIGLSSPPQLFTITGDANYIAHYDGSNYAFKLGADSSGDGNFMLHDSSGAVKVKLYAEANSANYIINGGNFGLGLTSPNERLEVSGNIRASGSYKVGTTEVISSGRRFFAADGSDSAPAYSFSGRTDTGMFVDDHGSNDRIFFSVDGNARAYIDSNGISSNATIYVSSAGSFRNYSGVWKATTGQSGNGFQFFNTADNSSAVLLNITSDSSAATASVATFSGKVKSAQTANSDGNDVLTTKSYVDGLVTGVTRYMGLWDASSGTGGSPDLTASTYKVPGYYFIVSVAGDAEPNGAGTEPDTWHVGDWVIWSDQATDAWQKIDNTSVLSGTGTANKLAMWNGDESLTNSRFSQNATTNIITGPGNAASDKSLSVTSGAGTEQLYIQGTGEVVVTQNYFYVSASQGAYINGILRARGGVTDDGGTLGLGGNGSVNNLVLTSNTSATFAGAVTTNGTLTIDGDGSSSVLLKTKGSARIALENANATDSFYLSNTGGNNASVLDLGGALSLVENGDATFSGAVSAEDNIYLTDAGTIRAKLLLNASDRDNVELRAESLGSTMKFFTVGTEALELDASQNATFAGDINIASSNINIDNNGAAIFDNSNNNNAWYIRNGGTSSATLQFGLGTPGANIKHTFDGDGNIAFGGDVTVNGGHLTLKNGTTYAQSTDYLYIGGSGLDNADAAIYLGNRGDGNSYGWRFIYKGTGSGNTNNLVIQSENANSPVDALIFNQNGVASFGSTVYIPAKLQHIGDADTFLQFSDDTITLSAGANSTVLAGNGNATFPGNINLGRNLVFDDATGGINHIYSATELNVGPVSSAHNATGYANVIYAGSPAAGTTNNIAGGHLWLAGGAGKGTGAGGDIVFRVAPPGSSGSSVNAYATALTISDDKSASFTGDVSVVDNAKFEAGTGKDLKIWHDGSNTKIENYTGNLSFREFAADGDVYFQADNGTGGGNIATYFYLDGGRSDGTNLATRWNDGSIILMGSGTGWNDGAQIYHSGSNFYLNEYVGNIEITCHATDGDIKFKSDDGSGGETEYFVIDGSAEQTRFYKDTRHTDNIKANFGNGDDFKIYHEGTDSIIQNYTGSIYIDNNANNQDIVFRCDDGSGGITNYIQIDGSEGRTLFNKHIRVNDVVQIQVGNNADLQIFHNSTDSYIQNNTGELRLISNDWALRSASSEIIGYDTTGDVVRISKNINFGDGHFLGDDGNDNLLLESSAGEAVIINGNTNVKLQDGGNTKLTTTSTGISVTGVIDDRDIPCLFNSNFEDAYGTSIIVVPFNNNTEANVSQRTYNHNLTMPYAGKLTKIVMKNVSGTLSSGFTTQLFLYVNGSQQASSSEISLSNSSVTWTPTTNNTFSAGDVLTFAYQKSAIKTFGGVSFGVAIELTDYDI